MRTRNTATLAAAAVAVVLVAVGAQEPETPQAIRGLVSPIALEGIDRGIREQDAPRPPATAATERQIQIRSDSRSYLAGSIIVKFRAGTSATAQQAVAASVGVTRPARLSYADFDIVTIDASDDPEAVARRLAAQPDVEYAQARYTARPMFVPNDPLYSRQWNFPAIDMERAWDINQGANASIIVAVIDTGVAFRGGLFRFSTIPFTLNGVPFPSLGAIDVPFAAAPDLDGPSRFVAPQDFIWNDANPLDLQGHGTHVAGTIGQLTNNSSGVAGMAFNVRIMPIKVLSSSWDIIFGNFNAGTDDVVARAVRYAVDNGAKVINMSIGRTGPPAPVVQEAVGYAVSRGAFVSVAAGNDFLEGNPPESYAGFAPQIDGMVAVGALAQDRQRARYSSTGSYVELCAPGGDQVRNGIPGGILQQTYDGDLVETFLQGPGAYRAPRFDAFAYEFFQGTSMAAPHVAGFAALLMQQGITNPAAIETIMKRYATDVGAAGRDNECGDGLINPRGSLRGMGLVR